MKSNINKIAGILLAGGKSSRMGKEKGLIRIGKQMMYQYPLKVLESLCDEIIISSCNQSFIVEDYPRVCDEIPGLGPIGGLYSSLKRSSCDINIVLSYDLPLVKRELIEELLKFIDGADIVLPAMENGRPEPLCGIYKRHVSDTFSELIKEGTYSVHSAISRVKTRIVTIDENLSFYHPKLFLNINHESDLSDLPADLL